MGLCPNPHFIFLLDEIPPNGGWTGSAKESIGRQRLADGDARKNDPILAPLRQAQCGLPMPGVFWGRRSVNAVAFIGWVCRPGAYWGEGGLKY
ncbi:MAG: hypothetical protein R2750_01865 [Bacteroidales bacterium]